MRHIKTMLLLTAMMMGMNAWADGTSSRVTVITKLYGGGASTAVGSVTADVGAEKVTLTANPATGYYITADEFTVELTTDGGNAQARRATASGPDYAQGPKVTHVSGDDVSAEQTFEFDIEDDENICYLVTASFRQCTSIADATVEVSGGPWTYSGKAHEPTVKVTLNGSDLTANTDYTVGYADNVNAGTATITVTGMGSYGGTASKTFTIDPAVLTGVTLEETELTYNLFDPQPQTVKVKEVKAGSLTVPAGQYDVKGGTQTEIGSYTVTVTGKTNFKGDATAEFSIVKAPLTLKVIDKESGQEIAGVDMDVEVSDREKKTLTIKTVTIPAAAAGRSLAIYIPGEMNGFQVTALVPGLLGSLDNVTDIYLADTVEPIAIGENALPKSASIHSSLEMLDDYALTEALKSNYEAMKISATVTPVNRLWTFSCGVDVVQPEGVTAYTAYVDGLTPRIVAIGEEQLKLAGGQRGIRANNGVLFACDNGKGGNSYEIVACPGSQQSGTQPTTTDAKSYAGNQLEPVIEPKNFPAGKYLVLKDNKFHSIAPNDSKVSACKAVLRIKN